MRPLFTLIIFFAFGLMQTKACSYAYQYSLFPMGSSAGNLIVLEAELERYVNVPDQMMGGVPNFDRSRTIETRWKGRLKLLMITKDTSQVLEELGFIDISDESYEDALKPYFQEAMDIAQKQPMFQRAELIQEGLCKYDNTCDFFTKTIDSAEVKLYCSINQEAYKDKLQEVPFPDILLRKFENMTKLKFSDIEAVEINDRMDFFYIWRKYSVRIYQIGGQQIATFTLGWGQKRFYKEPKAEKWNDNLPPVEEYIRGKDVMRHGQRFDFLQWL